MTLLLSKAVGYAIIAGSLMLKVPQIMKILQAKSVEGLSFTMYILELVGFAFSLLVAQFGSYTITMGYSFNSHFPISTWGEYIPITIQSMHCGVLDVDSGRPHHHLLALFLHQQHAHFLCSSSCVSLCLSLHKFFLILSGGVLLPMLCLGGLSHLKPKA